MKWQARNRRREWVEKYVPLLFLASVMALLVLFALMDPSPSRAPDDCLQHAFGMANHECIRWRTAE